MAKRGCTVWLAKGCTGCKKIENCEVVQAYRLCYALNKLNGKEVK